VGQHTEVRERFMGKYAACKGHDLQVVFFWDARGVNWITRV
jgi:hypothetical protein